VLTCFSLEIRWQEKLAAGHTNPSLRRKIFVHAKRGKSREEISQSQTIGTRRKLSDFTMHKGEARPETLTPTAIFACFWAAK